MASADTSIFSLQVGGFTLDTFRVIEFIGREAISECYSFTIRAVAFDTELTFDNGVGIAATLFIGGADYDIKHYGVITSFTQVPDSDGDLLLNFTYEFTFEPRIRWAAYMVQSRIFQNKTVLEIAEEVLSEYLVKDTDFKIDAKYEGSGDYSKREFTVQYNESDLDFLQRLLEDEGLSYFFDHTGDIEVMVVTNKKESFKPMENTPTLPFRPETGMHADDGEYVGSLQKTVKWVMGGRTTVKDYNYRTPDTKVLGVFDMAQSEAEYYHFGDHVKTTDEATRLAQIRGEMFAVDREVYRGTSIARSMHTGHRFTLEHADAEGFNGDYIVTRVIHKGDMQADEGTVDSGKGPKPHYTNSFEAIPAAVQFRPRLMTPKPKAPGILTAKVDGQKGSYAYLDEEGRYRMKLFFDRSEDTDGKASKAIRLAQPYAGAGYGMHFPLHTDTEIAVGFVDGDLDRPIGLGAIPNPGKGSPVKAGNKHQNMMKSHAGNSMILEDKEGATGIHMATAGGHSMGFDDSANTKGFSVKTSGGHIIAADDKGKTISMHSNGGIDLLLSDDKTKVVIDTHGNSLTMEDTGNVVTLKTAAGDSKITMKGDGHVEITTSVEIKLVVGSSSITMNTNGNIDIKGIKVNVTASDALTAEGTNTAAVTGKALTLTGSDSANLGGATVDVKAGQSLGLAGGIISSEATGANIVKGASVMLNP